MKYGDNSLSDPVQQLLEAQQFEPERHGRSPSFRQDGGVNPNPQISQQQGDDYKHQPQVRVSRTSVNARLVQLAKARFDAKAFAVAFADLGRSSVHTPGSEK